MERTSSPSYPDRPLSEQDETHMLVTLEQGVYHRPVQDCSPLAEGMVLYDRDVDMSIAEADLSGVSSEGDMDPQALFYHPYEHERLSKDGVVAPYGGIRARFQEGTGLFTHLPCPELPLHLEDPVTDEHVSRIRHSIGTTAHRSQHCTDGGEQMNLLKPTSMLSSSFQVPADLKNVKVSNDIPWERSLQEIREKSSREERSSKTFSDAKDFLNLHRPRENHFSLESRMATAMKQSNEQLGNNLLDVNSKLAMERYLASTSAPYGNMDSVKGADSFHAEHLEQIRTGVDRFDWVSEHDACTNSTYREVGLGIPLRGQTVRGDPPPITLPIFRKSLNPNLNKTSYYEGGLSHRKAMGMEQDLSHLSHLNVTTDWTLQKHSHQGDMDITGCKQTWTVNDDDSLEQIPPESLEPASCSSYNAETRQYMCSMMLGETEKEDIVQEDHTSVYTCIECSIYFNKKEHLMEHMLQHTREQGSSLQEPPLSVLSQFSCSECGWSFGDSTTLEQHRRLHQESREKIIEEIQKLNDFSDEGREARLQCPKCVFGTNSSKVFVQHAKMHVKERKDQEVKSILDSTVDEDQEVTAIPSFQQFKPNEPYSAGTPPQGQSLSSIKSAITCILCGFPARNETLLKQHMKFSHPSPSWSSESYVENIGTPGTSREAYSLPKPRPYPETEFYCKKERLTPPPLLQPQPTQLPPPTQPPPPLPTPNSSPPPPPHASQTLNIIPIKCEPGLDVAEDQRSDTSDIPIRKSINLTKFSTRKLLPFGSLQRKFGTSYPSSKGYVPNVALKIKKKILAPFKGHGIDNRRKHGAMLNTRHGWSTGKNSEGLGGGFSFRLKTGFLPTLKKLSKTVVPRPAMELKRRFRATLKSSDCSTISEKQRHQLQMMVPVVVLKPIGDRRKKIKPGRRFFKKKASFSHGATSIGPQFSRAKLRDKSLSLDLLLMDPSFEGSLDEDELLDPDSLILRSEEKKCPYCPDQFHNGIGLANHVRGHLNRVGVSYNVRHFISAEEVKAIEQKFSFQKKKKKGMANFDPGTYSLMRCEFCGAGFDTRAGLSSHARAHLRDFGITNWELTISPINILKELLANSPDRRALQALARSEPSSPNQKREPPSYQLNCTTPISEGSIPRSPRSPLASTWMEEPAQPYRDVSEEEEIVSMDIDSSSPQKKSPPSGPLPLDKASSQMGGGMSPDSLGSKQDLQDSKLQTLTTCEVCGASFETRKGLSSHARSHLRQLGVAESESSGAPIDLLYELAKQTKGKPESTPSSPLISKKPSSPPKDGMSSPHPPLQPLNKLPDAPTNRAIKSPPGFSHKSHPETGSPVIKKTHPHLSPSPTPKHMEEKNIKINMCSVQNSPRSHWGPSEDDGPLNLTVDDDPDSEIDCQLCGAWFETRKGLSSHARAHLRHLGVADPDSKGSPVDLLNDLIMSDDFQSRLLSLRPSERKLLAAVGVSEKPSPKNMGTAAAGSMAALSPLEGSGGGGMKKIMLPAAGGGGMKHYLPPHLRPFGKQQSLFPSHSSPPPKKLKQQMPHPSAQSGMQRKHSLSPGTYWPSSPAEMSPINLSSGAEPVRDIRCEFCGEYFENRKGLSSHARSHLRQMGVTEWYMNGSPIDTMRDLLRRRSLPRPSSNPSGPGPSPSPKSLHKPMASSGSLGSHSTVEIRVPTIQKKISMSSSSPMARSPHMAPPTARKMFHHMSPPSMHKKPKLEQMKFHFKREMMPVNVPNEHLSLNRGWESQDDLSPLNLSSRVEPVRDIRCEFCGEYFENRKGLSSHARSHLRQMGVTEWSVNGSPIDTLREILQKKNKPIQIKKESNAGSPEPQLPRPPPLLLPKPLREERSLPNSPGKHLQVMPSSPPGGRTGRPVQSHPSMTTMSRDLSLSLVGGKPHGAFLTPLSMKRPMPEERMIQPGDLKPKSYIQTELQFKSKVKSAQEKALAQMTSTEACCELCGLYFENRKALASHARAHLRQFGVTEWCVNGSPIETLTEWIKHRPQKAGAYRSYIQGGRPFTKKFRKAHASDREAIVKKLPMTLPSASAPGTMKTIENDNPHTESSKSAEVGSSSSIIDSPSLGSPSMHVQKEEFISQNINKFERRPARLPETPTPRDEEASDFQTKAEEVRQTPLKVRPVPSLVPRPPQTSLVKFVGNIYTLKCRFCEVEFQGPLSIQEEWVRHLQRHILEMNFSKAVVPLHEEVEVPMTTEVQ